MQLVLTTTLGEPTALCSLQAESVIVGYYTFRRKCFLVRLYARTDDLNSFRFFQRSPSLSSGYTEAVAPTWGLPCRAVALSLGPRVSRGPGATVATIATIVLPLRILPSQLLQPLRLEAQSFALARF